MHELNGIPPKALSEIENDEHHPYNHTYLFRDTALEKLISDSEKMALAQRSVELKSRRITLKGEKYATISSARNLTGFYIVTTEPMFTSDRKYAFIDLTMFYKDVMTQNLSETYFGTTCIVYEKQPDNKWKKIKIRNHLIL